MTKEIQVLIKLQQSKEPIKKFLLQTLKNYKQMKNTLSKIWLLSALTLIVGACGMTKASVSKPAAGTTTTITITTNNPVTTDVSPDVELNYKPNKN